MIQGRTQRMKLHTRLHDVHLVFILSLQFPVTILGVFHLIIL